VKNPEKNLTGNSDPALKLKLKRNYLELPPAQGDPPEMTMFGRHTIRKAPWSHRYKEQVIRESPEAQLNSKRGVYPAPRKRTYRGEVSGNHVHDGSYRDPSGGPEQRQAPLNTKIPGVNIGLTSNHPRGFRDPRQRQSDVPPSNREPIFKEPGASGRTGSTPVLSNPNPETLESSPYTETMERRGRHLNY